jgi:hypothetical protein
MCMSVCVCHVGSKRNGGGVTVVSDSQGGRGEDNDPRSVIPAIRVYVTQKEEARKDRQTDPIIPVDRDLKRKEEGLENGKVVAELRVVF